MYFCRRFLGLILTGLFVSSLLASADSPKEYNKYKLPLSRSNSEVQPKVLVKSIDQVDMLRSTMTDSYPEMGKASVCSMVWNRVHLSCEGYLSMCCTSWIKRS